MRNSHIVFGVRVKQQTKHFFVIGFDLHVLIQLLSIKTKKKKGSRRINLYNIEMIQISTGL